MDKYTELLKVVKTYIQDENNPKVKNGKISLFDLYCILDKNIKELYKQAEAEELLKKINEENKMQEKLGEENKITKKLINFLKKRDSIELFKEYDFVMLTFDSYDQSSEIVFFEKDGEIFSVQKDLDSNELYNRFNLTDSQKNIVNKHYEEIQDILISLQEYQNMLENNRSSNEQVFSDGFMNVKISYNNFGKLEVKIVIEKQKDPAEVSKRVYARREKIQDIIDEHKLEILKKVIIDPKNLNKGCQKILKREKSKV